MAIHSFIINKKTSSQRNLWLIAILIGLIIGCCFAGVGVLILHPRKQLKLTYVVVSILLGGASGVLIGWYAKEVLRSIIAVISSDLTDKAGLKIDNFSAEGKGLSKEFAIFDQMFKLVVSILKRVLVISFKLEEASIDLDRTAQLSSQVIKEVVEGVEEVNAHALSNAANLRETISSLDSSFGLSKDISSKLIIAKDDSHSVSVIAKDTQSSVKEAVQKMFKIKDLTDGSATLVNELNDRSKQIGTILTEIANIAEKTNLLALNAAIEAARAGEHGLGFAVVADEVRKLARGSAESSKKINNLITDILQKTENAADMMQNNTIQVNLGMQVVNHVEASLGEMVKTTNQLNNIIKDISLSAERQSETSSTMYQKVNTISKITDDISQQIQNIANSALGKTVIVDQTSASAKDLRTLSDVFQNSLVPFDFEVEGIHKRASIRTETRISCKFKVLLSGELIDGSIGSSDFEMRGVIKNLSAGGCIVETSENVEQGKYVILSFQVGSNFIHSIQGRLVRLKVATMDSEEISLHNKEVYECVVSFNNVSKEDEKTIVNFVMSEQRQFEVNLGINHD